MKSYNYKGKWEKAKKKTTAVRMADGGCLVRCLVRCKAGFALIVEKIFIKRLDFFKILWYNVFVR